MRIKPLLSHAGANNKLTELLMSRTNDVIYIIHHFTSSRMIHITVPQVSIEAIG